MGRATIVVLQVVIAFALAGSLVVQAFIAPAVWIDLDGAPLAARIAFVSLLVLGVIAMQVFGVCVWQLLSRVRRGSVFAASSFRYVDIIIWSIAAAALIVFAVAGWLPARRRPVSSDSSAEPRWSWAEWACSWS